MLRCGRHQVKITTPYANLFPCPTNDARGLRPLQASNFPTISTPKTLHHRISQRTSESLENSLTHAAFGGVCIEDVSGRCDSTRGLRPLRNRMPATSIYSAKARRALVS